jgi:DNA-binding transcriptional MocR family regulator
MITSQLVDWHRCRDASGSGLHGYGPIVGAEELRAALRRKLQEENGLDLSNQEVMVTAGANQVRTSLAPHTYPHTSNHPTMHHEVRGARPQEAK